MEAERARMREEYDYLAAALEKDMKPGDRKSEQMLKRIAKQRAALGPDDGQLVDLSRLEPHAAAWMESMRAGRPGVGPDGAPLAERDDLVRDAFGQVDPGKLGRARPCR